MRDVFMHNPFLSSPNKTKPAKNSHLSAMDEGAPPSENFEATSGPGSALPFRDKNQSFVLYSLTHVGIPPRGGEAGLRVYGAFPTKNSAKAFAKNIQEADPTCSLAIAPTHEWILIPKNVDLLSDAEYINKETERLLKRLSVENSVSKARFEQHQKELREKSAVPEEDCPIMVEKMDDDEKARLEKGDTSADPKPDPGNDPDFVDVPIPLPMTCKLSNQESVVISFVFDDKTKTDQEILFKVYRVCRNDEEASNFARNVVCKNVKDVDVDVADCGEWLLPLNGRQNIERHYRDKRLDDLMKKRGKEVDSSIMDGCTLASPPEKAKEDQILV